MITIFLMLQLPLLVEAKLERNLKPNEIRALDENVRKDPNNIKSRLFLGNHYYKGKNWQKSVEYLGPIAEKLPDTELFKLSTAYLNLGQYRDSEAIANILLSKENVSTKSYLLAIKIYSRVVDNLERAELKKPIVDQIFKTLKTAQQKDPENPEIYDVWLAAAEAHVTHFAFDALRVVEDMKKNSIRFTPRHLSLQCKYNYLAEFTKATKLTCEKAIVHDPSNPSNYIYLGQTKLSTGDEIEGKRMLASVGKKFSSSEEALWATADSYYQSKNVSSAYLYYKKASRHKNAKPRGFLGLAKSAFELKKYDEALAAFVKHCKITRVLHQEFRRASGLLKKKPRLQELYRQKMMDCKPPSGAR